MRLMYKKCVNLKYSFILKGGVGRGPKEYVSDFVMKLAFTWVSINLYLQSQYLRLRFIALQNYATS